MGKVEINKTAPDFELKDYKENNFKLSDFKGEKNVLLVLNRGFI